jgi:hypothetical protein
MTLLGRERRKGEKERELRLLEDVRGRSLDDEEEVRRGEVEREEEAYNHNSMSNDSETR